MAQRTTIPPAHPANGEKESGGVEGNARLTAVTGAVLLVLLAAEGVTVLSVRSLLTPHVVIGLLLIPPVVVKLASTSWKFSRYYLKHPEYRRQGPPVAVLRVLGPVVVVLTVVLFASGTWLLLAPSALGGRLLLIHKVSFFLWFAAMTVHVLGHLRDTGRAVADEARPRTRRLVPGAGGRQVLILAALVAGVGLALALDSHVSTYLHARALLHL